MTPNQRNVATWAPNSFKDHVLTCEANTDKVKLYHCAKPGTNIYSFRVILSPGCIVVYGDIGDRMILNYRPLEEQVSWLRSAVNSTSYIIEKMPFKEEEFCEETAKKNFDYLREAYEDDDERLKLLTDEQFRDICKADDPKHAWGSFMYYELEDDEPSSCTDYGSHVYWTIECLKKFVELLNKEPKHV